MTDLKDKVSKDGRRYIAKTAGTSFNSNAYQMSCYACSKRSNQKDGTYGTVLNRATFFCSEACKARVIKPKKIVGQEA